MTNCANMQKTNVEEQVYLFIFNNNMLTIFFLNIKLKNVIKSSFLNVENDLRTVLEPVFQIGFGDLSRVGSCALLGICMNNVVAVGNGINLLF